MNILGIAMYQMIIYESVHLYDGSILPIGKIWFCWWIRLFHLHRKKKVLQRESFGNIGDEERLNRRECGDYQIASRRKGEE